MLHPAALPGFLASVNLGFSDVHKVDGVSRSSFGSIELRHWGLDSAPGPELALVVSGLVRNAEGSVAAERIGSLLRSDPVALTRLLPPFAAVAVMDQGVTAVADSLGFQHLFHTDGGRVPLLASSILVA